MMVAMIDKTAQSDGLISRFYDTLAPEYDGMTDFDNRFARENPFFRILVERYGISTALDAGCGTGFHSLVLDRLGVDVTASDISFEMLRRSASHARSMGARIHTVQSSFQDLPSHLNEKFDAVFCLGNSLVHLIEPSDLEITLKNFSSLLRPGGILFLQVLNYERILNERKTIQHMREVDGTIITREYEYHDGTIGFTIRGVPPAGGGKTERMNTIEIRPVLRTAILPMLTAAGFGGIKTFGSISMVDFVPADSRDLVILATRGEEKSQ